MSDFIDDAGDGESDDGEEGAEDESDCSDNDKPDPDDLLAGLMSEEDTELCLYAGM